MNKRLFIFKEKERNSDKILDMKIMQKEKKYAELVEVLEIFANQTESSIIWPVAIDQKLLLPNNRYKTVNYNL